MTNHQRNQLIAVVAIVLIVLTFVLVVAGVIDALMAILFTLIIGFGVRLLRGMLLKP